MKKLSSVFKNDNKKKSSALTNVKAEETTPRKINEDDYEVIRTYAFQNKLTMLQTTELLHEEIQKSFEDKKDSLCNMDMEEFQSPNQKSIRISVALNEYLREKSNEIRVPSKMIFSFFVNNLKSNIK